MSKKNPQKLSSHLLKEWHPTRNGSMNPLLLTAKSGKSPWWQCIQCSYSWKAPIYHRSNGTGCPKCKHKSAWTKHLHSILDTRGSFASNHPILALEWHPIKNGIIKPDQISASSGKKFWWRCAKGEDHEWEAIASNRAKGRGCPSCAGRKAVMSNCFLTTHPNIAEEWHRTKNGALLPSNVTFASHKKVWWQCTKGHEWATSVANRTSRGKSECPICLKLEIGQRRVRSLIKKSGSLEEIFPAIAQQWHPDKNGIHTPSNFTAGSSHKAWWRCSKGHEWYVAIRARRTYGCPKCTYQTSQLEIRVYCELKEIFNDAKWRERIDGNECDIILSYYKIALEIDGFPWHKDRESQDRLKRDRLLAQGISLIRIRDERLLPIDENDIFYKKNESHIQIILRIMEILKNKLPLSISEKSKLIKYLNLKKLTAEDNFKKILNDVWTVPEKESISHLYPTIVLDWDYKKNGHLNPRNFSPGSQVPVYWKCQKQSHHTWKSTISNRIKSKQCPFCSGKRVCSDNSLAILHPKVAAQWDYEKNIHLPTQVSAGSSRKIWWKCHCNFSWQATIWSRVNSSNPECLNCYNQHGRGQSQIRKAVQKNGSFADKYPSLAQEWHPTKNASLTAHLLSCGSNINVWWKCPKGGDHEWQNSIVSRIQYPTCPFCCGKKVSLINSLQYCFPDLAKEWHPTKNTIKPTEITKCSGRKLWWQCSKGHSWEASVTARRKGNGCPFCAGKKAAFGDNFESHYPKLAIEWHKSMNYPTLPAEFRSNSNSKVWWLCPKHSEHVWEASIASRTRGTGCPFCAGKKTSTFYNLMTINPSLAQEWHPSKNSPLTSQDVTPNSGKKVWWQCLKNHEWQATINNRTKGRGCPLCRTKKSNLLREQLKQAPIDTDLQIIHTNTTKTEMIS